MQKLQSDTLNGSALLWATCIALKLGPVVADTGIAYRSDHGSWVYPRFTSDQEVGELMAKELVGVERPCAGQKVPVWRAIADSKLPRSADFCNLVVSAFGETLGVAVCRAIVLSRCGNTIEVPDELCALEVA